MPGIENGQIGQGVYLLANGLDQLLAGRLRKIGTAD